MKFFVKKRFYKFYNTRMILIQNIDLKNWIHSRGNNVSKINFDILQVEQSILSHERNNSTRKQCWRATAAVIRSTHVSSNKCLSWLSIGNEAHISVRGGVLSGGKRIPNGLWSCTNSISALT